MYHFTHLIHLPNIVKQGLTRGELAGTKYPSLDVISITTNPDRRAISFFDCYDATVRLIVDTKGLPLLRWKEAYLSHGGKSSKLKLLDPTFEGRKNWYVHFGTIPFNKILSIEQRQGMQYEPIPDLDKLVGEIQEEIDRAVIFHRSGQGRFLDMELKSGVENTWLLPTA